MGAELPLSKLELLMDFLLENLDDIEFLYSPGSTAVPYAFCTRERTSRTFHRKCPLSKQFSKHFLLNFQL